ncbi:MAG: hypothetical protein Q4E12_00885 [Coriobacteriia bacterium]|nr:hypothetical protein [Coriobacteriia bacterium]
MDQILNLLKMIPQEQIEKFIKDAIGVSSEDDANGLASKFDLGDLSPEHIQSLINFQGAEGEGEGEGGGLDLSALGDLGDLGNMLGGLFGKK